MREKLFLHFFNWEQEHIVGPAVTDAFDALDWDSIKQLARRTRLAFSYFGKDFGVKFVNFASTEERIMRGLQVYRRAEDVGLARVERALGDYKRGPAPRVRDCPLASPDDLPGIPAR
jgi:hypothetical protein